MTAPTDVSLDPAERESVAAIVRRSGSSFYWAMRILPPVKRDAMFAIYAFCRTVDDIADGDGVPEGKYQALDAWQEEIDRLYAGRPTETVTRALVDPVGTFGLAKADFDAVIAGMRMDAGTSLRIADWDELALYCDRVACAVGRLSNAVFGVPAETKDKLATALGEALQLTNILRDVREDAERDRIYLPAELLARHGIAAPTSKTLLAQSGLAGACAEVAACAETRFGEADALLAACDRRIVRPALIMKTVYHDMLRRLEKRGWTRVSEPVRQTKLRKSGLVVKALLTS